MQFDIGFMAQNLSMLFIGLAIFLWTIVQSEHWDDQRRERQKNPQNSKKSL